jgi:hypothetical protein
VAFVTDEGHFAEDASAETRVPPDLTRFPYLSYVITPKLKTSPNCPVETPAGSSTTEAWAAAFVGCTVTVKGDPPRSSREELAMTSYAFTDTM